MNYAIMSKKVLNINIALYITITINGNWNTGMWEMLYIQIKLGSCSSHHSAQIQMQFDH